MATQYCWIAGSLIFLLLGGVHLFYTFFTNKFNLRDTNTQEAMKNTSLLLTRETTAWNAITGFHASHSTGAIFLGIINGYFAIRHFSFLEHSYFLQGLTLLTSIFYLFLAKRYWFSIPFRGMLIATACFLAGILLLLFK